jgi:hypothetical protein
VDTVGDVTGSLAPHLLPDNSPKSLYSGRHLRVEGTLEPAVGERHKALDAAPIAQEDVRVDIPPRPSSFAKGEGVILHRL